MKRALGLVVMSLLAPGLTLAVSGQPLVPLGGPSRIEIHLRQMFPTAGDITGKEGQPPHFTVFAVAPQRVVIGVAFITTDITPLERGYDGPISLLVGMDPAGVIAGVALLDHHEPYGYFSIETSRFAEQFKGKSVRDPFRVGSDIDVISRATMTMNSATRSVRNGARIVARAVLAPPQ